MNLCHNFKIICTIFSLTFLLSACSSTIFPDIEESDTHISDSQNRRYIEESSSLASDKENIAYEDDDDDTPSIVLASKASTDKGEEIAAAKTIPVVKGQPEGYVEEKIVTNDADLNKLLEEGTVSTDKPSDKDYKTAKTVKVDTSKKYKTSEAEASNEQSAEDQNVEQAPRVFSVSYRIATILFDNGSEFVNSEYNSQVREIVKLAKENDAIIHVYGYASSRTRNTDIATHKLANFEVSNKRAESVAKALRRAGLPADRIVTEALSDTNPAYLEVMPEGERLNRRAEVYISY